MKIRPGALLFCLALLPAAAAQEAAVPGAGIGMACRLDNVVLPGPELEAVPTRPQDKGMLRVAAVRPHGTAFRYDLVFFGYEPGSYDLSRFLRRQDGTAAEGLPAVPVQIHAVLPRDRLEPNELGETLLPEFGGYQTLLWVAGALWVVGLVAILFLGRRRRREAAAAAVPLTLADRLRPMVQAAMQGSLSAGGHAELERTLLSYWSRRLHLGHLPAAATFAALQRDEQAGLLVRTLERWLHQPPGKGEEIDIGALLRPYENAPAETPEPELAQPAPRRGKEAAS